MPIRSSRSSRRLIDEWCQIKQGVHVLATHAIERYGGDAAFDARPSPSQGNLLALPLLALPGFGEMKIKALDGAKPFGAEAANSCRHRRSATPTPCRRWQLRAAKRVHKKEWAKEKV
jgi:hypothetical protein